MEKFSSISSLIFSSLSWQREKIGFQEDKAILTWVLFLTMGQGTTGQGKRLTQSRLLIPGTLEFLSRGTQAHLWVIQSVNHTTGYCWPWCGQGAAVCGGVWVGCRRLGWECPHMCPQGPGLCAMRWNQRWEGKGDTLWAGPALLCALVLVWDAEFAPGSPSSCENLFAKIEARIYFVWDFVGLIYT